METLYKIDMWVSIIGLIGAFSFLFGYLAFLFFKLSYCILFLK